MCILPEPVIGDPYGLYPEPRQEPDILNAEVFSAGANGSDQSSEDEIHRRPLKKTVSWHEEDGSGEKTDNDWYWPQPFLYNGRILLVGLPGFLLTFSVGGDL